MEFIMNLSKNYWKGFAVLFVVASCASGPTMIPFNERMQGETESSTELRAYVGDIVFSKYDFTERYEGRITASFKATGGTYTASDVLYTRTLINGGDGGCTSTMVMSGGSLMTYGIDMQLPSHCLYDSNGNGSLDKGYAAGLGDFKLNPNIPMPAWIQSADTTGTKKELIYQGRDGSTLRLRYREFFRDIVRPSYDQTVEYNLDEGLTISFRGLSISIIEADNQYLIYSIDGGTLEL
jgi:hypothetical protein|tara:strand:+ start:285 stop:995 length:711 start_codon:yes stop_codon:yes gene_type:complete